MFNIWFERNAPDKYQSMYEELANGISPGDKIAENAFFNLDKAHAVVAGGRTYNSEVMDQAPNLLVISRAGIGYEKVDIEAATAHGIAVCNAPDAPTVSTAECAITLMMSVARNIKRVEGELRRVLETGAKNSVWMEYRALELNGLQLGLVGLGRIGGHVSRVAKALGMRVVTYDPYISDERAAEMGVERAESLEALLGSSDVVSLHLPLVPETYKIMNAERFGQMKEGAVFINVSRGGHVDEEALLEALDSGHLWGAGLDVTDPEPPLAENPLLYRDNVVLTPHIASATLVGRERLFIHAMEHVLYVLRGEKPPNLINPEVWPQVAEKWAAAKS